MCNCIEEVNEFLESKGHDAKVLQTIPLTGGPSKPLIARVRASNPQKDPLRKVPHLIASYCPWCGEQFDSEEHRG